MTSNRHPDKESDLQPEINKIFEMVAMAKASTSGHEAIRMGYGRSGDTVVMNQDYRIYEAKQAVLAMDRAGYVPPRRAKPALSAATAGPCSRWAPST